MLLALAQDPDGIAGQVLAELGVRKAVKARLAELLVNLEGGCGAVGHPDDAVCVDLVSATGSNHPLRLLDPDKASPNAS